MENKINICAPLINRWRPQSCHQGHSELDAKSKELLGKLFRELSRLETCGRDGDEIYNLWLCADRGPMEAFGDWEEYVAEGEVKNRAEFEELWKSYYPNERVWYEMAACRNEKGYMAVYLKHRQWIEIRPDEKKGEWLDMSEPIQWMIDGRSWSRCIETAKFFLALSYEGLPVVVYDGKTMAARFLGTDKVGIVPDGMFPRYCETLFPGEKILDFMNLPFEKRDEVTAAAVWQPLDHVELTRKA